MGLLRGSEVVTNRTGCAGQAVQTALAAGLCMYAAGCTDGSGAGTTAPGMPPNVVVGEDDWSGVAMLGDDLLPAAPYYRAVLHLRGNLDIVLPQGSEETKMELARESECYVQSLLRYRRVTARLTLETCNRSKT